MNTKHRKLVELIGCEVYTDREYFHHKLDDRHFDAMNRQDAVLSPLGFWVEAGHRDLEALAGGLDAPEDIPCGGMSAPLVRNGFTHQLMIERGRSLEDVKRMNATVDALIDEILAERAVA